LALIRRAFLMQGGAGLGMSLILGLGAFVWAPWYLRLPGATLPLMLLSPVVVLGALSYVYGLQTLLAFGHERYYSRVLVVAGLLNVALLFALLSLPYADKASLAAIAVTLVEVYIVAAFWWRARLVYREIRP